MTKFSSSRLSLALVLLFLISCTTNYQAPVGEVGQATVSTATVSQPVLTRNVPATRSSSPRLSHAVTSGETLYAIAFQYDLDFSALARVNGILAPYLIFPGQVLELDISKAPPPSSTPASGNGNSGSRVVSNTATTRATGTGQVQAIMRWTWPASGNVISEFSSTGVENKGIDIGGEEGDSVLAAEAGEVVYAGSGLLRYGDLLIIKHNEQFLSAYAHNSQLLVAEGDKVSRGQKIAALGSTGIDHNMLHFEIRLNGNPVDPSSYLPPR